MPLQQQPQEKLWSKTRRHNNQEAITTTTEEEEEKVQQQQIKHDTTARDDPHTDNNFWNQSQLCEETASVLFFIFSLKKEVFNFHIIIYYNITYQ